MYEVLGKRVFLKFINKFDIFYVDIGITQIFCLIYFFLFFVLSLSVVIFLNKWYQSFGEKILEKIVLKIMLGL